MVNGSASRLSMASTSSPTTQRIAASGNDDDEFVAAETADLAAIAGDLDQTLADLDQELIAGRVTERIVDVLEAVEIEQRDCGGIAVAAQQSAQLLLQREAVGQAGELVVVRDAPELLFGALLRSVMSS